MLITNRQGKARQDHNETSPHTCIGEDGEKRDPFALFVRM